MSIGLRRALDVLSQRCELNFDCYEPATLHGRIRRRIERVAGSDAAYAELLYSDPDEADSLYRDVLVGATEFFGDRESYAQLGRAIRTLLKHADGELRVWVAGCATGEELYSIAILLDEASSQLEWGGRIRLFATDVHQQVLKQASEGIFSKEALKKVSAVRRRRYFVDEGEEHVRACDKLREMAVFANHNLLTDAPFSQLDLICCRNVLTYFEPGTRERVLEQFRSALQPDGLLFLGQGEFSGAPGIGFDAVRPGSSLYVKRLERRRAAGDSQPDAARRNGGSPEIPQRGDPSELEVYEALLERYMPAAFVLDASERLVSCFGGAEELLAVDSPGAPAPLTDLLRGGLKSAAARLLDRYRRQGGGVHMADVRAAVAHADARGYRLTVSPLGRGGDAGKRILVEVRSLAG